MTGNHKANLGTPPEPVARLTYRIPEVAVLLSSSRRKVQDLIRDGELDVVPIGHIRMVPHKSIVAYIERQTANRDDLQRACDRTAEARSVAKSA